MKETFKLLTVGELIAALEYVPDETIVMVNKSGSITIALGVGCGEEYQDKETITINTF